VVEVETKRIVKRLEDETGRQIGSEKLLEVQFGDGKPLAAGNSFGVGGKK
jgi:hypothetical protein